MSKKPITVKDGNGSEDKIGINLNDFDFSALKFLKIADGHKIGDLAFMIIAEESGVPLEEVSINFLKESAVREGIGYSELFRRMLMSYLKKRLADRKYRLPYAHKRIFGQTGREKMEKFLDTLASRGKVKNLDIIKRHYLDGVSLRKIAQERSRSQENIRMAKDAGLHSIRVEAARAGARSAFDEI